MSRWKKAALIAAPLVVLLALGAFALATASDGGKTCSSTKSAATAAKGCPMKGAATTDAVTASASGCPMHSAASADAAPASASAGAEGAMPGCSMHGGAKAADAASAGAEGAMPGCSMHADAKATAAAAGGCVMGAGAGCCSRMSAATAAACGPMGAGAMSMGAGCGPMGAGAMGCGPGPGAMAARLRDLDLTPEQRRKVASAHESAQRAAIQAQADLRLAALDLRKLVTDERPDRARIDAQIDKLARLRAALQKAHVAALLEVRSVLTPEQAKKLQAADLPFDE